jgi:hypothetical protein
MSIARAGIESRPSVRERARTIVQIGGPTVIVACVLAFAISSGLARYHGSFAGFIQFGQHFIAQTHPPSGSPVSSPFGFDGQFFYIQALDPLLLHNSTIDALRAAHGGYRLQRAAYPALAFLLAAGKPSAIPLALLAINVIVLLALGAGFTVYARRHGWSTWWALAVALMPGMLLPTLRDLSDPLATASVLAGLLLWRGQRRWPAALALTVAVLTREAMILVVVALAAEAAARAWQSRHVLGAWRRIALRAWPVVVVPAAAFLAWQAYITVRYGGPVGSAGLNPPLLNLVAELGGLRGVPPQQAGWDVVYVALILAACAMAICSLRARVTITSAAACALVVTVVLPTMGDVWSDTRVSASLFAVLLVDGLQRRNRWSVLIAAAAAAMTILIPAAIPGSF